MHFPTRSAPAHQKNYVWGARPAPWLGSRCAASLMASRRCGPSSVRNTQLMARKSSAVTETDAAAIFSSRWVMEAVPGIGSITGA